MRKQVKVHLVSTNVDDKLRGSIYKHSENGSIVVGFLNARSTKDVPQHIHFTSDEEIKSGDVFTFKFKDEECKTLICIKTSETAVYHKDGNAGKQYCSKIVATSDKGILRLFKASQCVTLRREGREYTCQPQVPQSFIEAYANNPVEEVKLEYIIKGRCEDPMVCLRGCEISDGSCRHLIDKKILLKLTPNNEVIVHFIEEEMYSRGDMIKAYNEGELAGAYIGLGKHPLKGKLEWIKENLN
jgi:hypothetical protein